MITKYLSNNNNLFIQFIIMSFINQFKKIATNKSVDLEILTHVYLRFNF